MNGTFIDRQLDKAASQTRWANNALDRKDTAKAREHATQARRLLTLIRCVRIAEVAAQFAK